MILISSYTFRIDLFWLRKSARMFGLQVIIKKLITEPH